MLQRNAGPPRGPRNSTPSVRGPSRGGIQKRRGAPARVDKDGDLVMDAEVGGRRQPGKGRLESSITGRSQAALPYKRGGGSKAQQKALSVSRGLGAQQANIVEGSATLKVEGLKSSKAASNSDGGLEALLGFLERKAAGRDSKSNRPVRIRKSHIEGDSVYITASQDDITEIARLDNYTFAGATLTITATDPISSQRSGENEGKHEVSQAVTETKEKFRAILASRYDGNLKLLNLSALAQDPGLLEMGLGAFDGKVTSKLFPAMMVVCDQMFSTWQEKRDAIVSVTLANNGLDNVRHVTALATTFPNLKNLDLSANNLCTLKSIDSWRWKFRHLENLVLTGNPLTTEPNFNVELVKWYPKLLELNGIQVRTPGEVAATIKLANSPIPIKGPSFRDVDQVGENFIRQFFGRYDNDRAALLSNYYDNQSLFSISIDTAAPRDREHMTPVPAWAAYMKHSRNLKKFTKVGARHNRRYQGIQAIQSTWSELPPTCHPDINTQTDKYIIECHPVPGLLDPSGQNVQGVDGLKLTIHGEFEEQIPSATDKALRSFSRSFVIGPGGPGSPPIKVISDMLCLRAHSPLAAHTTTPQPQIQQAPQTELTPEQQQQALAKQLMDKTHMTIDYAVLCLTETGWNLEAAYQAFLANKDKLPPNAFENIIHF